MARQFRVVYFLGFIKKGKDRCELINTPMIVYGVYHLKCNMKRTLLVLFGNVQQYQTMGTTRTIFYHMAMQPYTTE